MAADVKDVFEELKNKKTLQFVVFHITNATKKKGSPDPQEIQVLSKEAAGPSLVDAEASEKDKAWKKTHQEFIDAISKDNCRYVVLDF
ncbi:hypothetical protein, partial [Salmonella sp. s55004]|uniref:hypothetical protein n=1 Tax=Salmonella sp. s55004 TaxID=3159675 RepID=UPI00397F6B40